MEKKLYNKILLLIGAFLLICTPQFTFAHGEVTNQTKVVGNYAIEFEYDDLGPMFALEPYNYDFYLLDKNTKEKVPVDSMSAVLSTKDGRIILGANLKTNNIIGSTGRMTGVMPSAGSYTADLTFIKDGTKIAEATFDYKVLSSVTNSKTLEPAVSNSPSLSNGEEVSKTSEPGKRNSSVGWIFALFGGIIIGVATQKFILGKTRK